jgi:predicted RNA-binding protein with EMAP domain
MAETNVAQRLTFVTGIGVSLRDYSRWSGGFKGTDTEKAIAKLFGRSHKPTVQELMYCVLLSPRLVGKLTPEIQAVRSRVEAIFEASRAAGKTANTSSVAGDQESNVGETVTAQGS